MIIIVIIIIILFLFIYLFIYLFLKIDGSHPMNPYFVSLYLSSKASNFAKTANLSLQMLLCTIILFKF